MDHFDITMQHTEESLYALSHMQYDLFCTRNFIARSILSIALIAAGAYFLNRFWGILLLAYGGYLMTSSYSSSNHSVKQLLAQIEASGSGFPSSRYRFGEKGIRITWHPGMKDENDLDPVGYGDILKLGEDRDYYYLFPTDRGGYCVPKAALNDQEKAFVTFLEQKTGKHFYRRRPSPLQRLRDWLEQRNSEPEHL